MKVLRRQRRETQRVYDIGVEDNHNFLTMSGAVASNCFNKSHSVAYSFITYACAYLKAHHPIEFFAALMTIRSKSLQPKDWALKAPEYINEAKTLGVKIYPPSINASAVGFTVQEDEIYFGLNAIRDCGITTSRAIVAARRKKPYASVMDFIERVNLSKVNTKHFQALVRAGAFDRLGYSRKDLLDNTAALYDYVKDFAAYHERTADILVRDRENAAKQARKDELEAELKAAKAKKKAKEELTAEDTKTLERLARLKGYRARIKADGGKEDFSIDMVMNADEVAEYEESLWLRKKPTLKPKVEAVRPEIKRQKTIKLTVYELMQQAEYIGCYIGTHPATLLYPNHTRIGNLVEGEREEVAGALSDLRVITTRTGSKMAFATIGDGTGQSELTIFPQTWGRLASRPPEVGNIVRVKGKVERIDPETSMKVFKMEVYRSNQ